MCRNCNNRRTVKSYYGTMRLKIRKFKSDLLLLLNWKSIKKLERQIYINAFPKEFCNDAGTVADLLLAKPFLIHKSKTQDVVLKSERLTIPYRFYFPPPCDEIEKRLTPTQRAIYRCICTRNGDGFIRQAALEKLLDSTNDAFIIPYVVILLGEYINEIVEVADRYVNDSTIDDYSKFYLDNCELMYLTQCRVISYWNEYYRRRFPNRNDYPAQQILDRIKRHA